MLHESTAMERSAASLSRQGSFNAESFPGAENKKVDLKRVFLSDLVLLLNHSKENRRFAIFFQLFTRP